MTENNRTFDNYNLVGCSPHVFRKIHSEAKTSLMLGINLTANLQKVREEQAKEINTGKLVRRYLQTITISRLPHVHFTEGALILWNKARINVPVSWNATGGIVTS